MLVGCSKISVFVKHVQHVGIIWACSLPGVDLLSFSVPGGTEKIAGLSFAMGDYPSGGASPKPMIPWPYKKSLKMRPLLVTIIISFSQVVDLS